MSDQIPHRQRRLDWLMALSAAVAVVAGVAPTAALAAPLATQAAACEPWQASIAYVKDDTATQNGKTYRANWWTQGDDPATHNGPDGSGQPWTEVSSCSSPPPPPPPPP
ncbi:MAG TPA: carbohydrate-binding protein, partial [Ideonella sp.]|uniref:carbohydrate-binding protein n=1 Tax=Ideonella sp. TaxID=1929293 RepID=UPI002E33EC3F